MHVIALHRRSAQRQAEEVSPPPLDTPTANVACVNPRRGFLKGTWEAMCKFMVLCFVLDAGSALVMGGCPVYGRLNRIHII